jgi:hypothetical protein
MSLPVQVWPVQSLASRTGASPAGVRVTVTGWSRDFVLQELLSNAVAQLRATAGARPSSRS